MTHILNRQLLKNPELAQRSGIRIELPKHSRNGKICGIVFGPGAMGMGMSADKMFSAHAALNGNGDDARFLVGFETHNPTLVAHYAVTDYLGAHLLLGDTEEDITLRIHNAIDRVVFISEDRSDVGWHFYRETARDPNVTFAFANVPEQAYGCSRDGRGRMVPNSPAVRQDIEQGTCTSHLFKWCGFLEERFRRKLKFDVISGTNFSGNGDFFRDAMALAARAREHQDATLKGFADWVLDRRQVGFPNTMIDRIAVAPNDRTRGYLAQAGILAPLVVTERESYFVIEQAFVGPEPPIRGVPGVYFEDSKESVEHWEAMKLESLNKAHSTVASVGSLLGFDVDYGVSKAMRDPLIRGLCERMIDSVLPTFTPPSAKKPCEFVREMFVRLENPNIPDDPRRIARGAMDKIAPRFTRSLIRLVDSGRPLAEATPILVGIAGMLRYMVGVRDNGEPFEIEDVGRAELVRRIFGTEGALFGDPGAGQTMSQLIADPGIMGLNLYQYPRNAAPGESAGDKVQWWFGRMNAHPGAVREVLEEVCATFKNAAA